MNRSWNQISLTNEKSEFFKTDQSRLRMSLQKNNDEKNYDEVEEEGGCAKAETRSLHSFFVFVYLYLCICEEEGGVCRSWNQMSSLFLPPAPGGTLR